MSPYFRGWEIAEKCDDALILRVVVIKWLIIENPENKLARKG